MTQRTVSEKTEDKPPLPLPFAVFPAYISLRGPHNLNVWNRLQLGNDENLKPISIGLLNNAVFFLKRVD